MVFLEMPFQSIPALLGGPPKLPLQDNSETAQGILTGTQSHEDGPQSRIHSVGKLVGKSSANLGRNEMLQLIACHGC